MKLDFDVAIIGAGVSGMTSAIYSLVSDVNSSATFKALPIGTIRTPSANGSNVPV